MTLTAREIIALIDLTSLDENDTDNTICALIDKADTPLGKVAAICIYPNFLSKARLLLPKGIKLATVINFPFAKTSIDDCARETTQALLAGADEIDLVIPYQDYLKNGHSEKACTLVREIKARCKAHTLKVIVESGELKTVSLIEKASMDAIENGADFIKTSTGKSSVGATLSAAETMLKVIQHFKQIEPERKVGFKASGGIRTFQDACQYLHLAGEICGKGFITQDTLRFGASGLLDHLLNKAQPDNHASR